MRLIIEFEVNDNFGIGKFGRITNFAASLGAKFIGSHKIKRYRLRRINDENININRSNVNNTGAVIKTCRMVSGKEK